jgi:hypothetical protein
MRLLLCVVIGCSLAGRAAAAEAWPDLAAANLIDLQLLSRFRDEGLVPSPPASDAAFLRRLWLSTIGQLPAPAEVRAFLADKRPDKRAHQIEALLAHPLHAALWATRFGELTGNTLARLEGPDELKPKRAKMWHDWLRRRFAENVPCDQLVRGILAATSRGALDLEAWIDDEAALVLAARQGFDADYAARPQLDLFWRRELVDGAYPAEDLAERVASSFLGVRIGCARCHNHPFDRWKQADYRGFVAVFQGVRFDLSPELRIAVARRIDARRALAAAGQDVPAPLPRVREVFVSAPPPAPEASAPRLLGGPAIAAGTDPRVALADWLADPANPYFARNLVNRVWAHHFGRGLVEPLDGFSQFNPPAHPELLALLAADFVDHGYDLGRLERLILNSTVWQLSSEPNDTNRAGATAFSRAYVRLPPAETVVDMWRAATGAAADFGPSVPGGIRDVEIGPSRLGSQRWDRLLDLFHRAERTQTCDCGPGRAPSIRQSLALMCDADLLGDLSAGDLPALVAALPDDAQLLEELFLRTLSRLPTADERAVLADVATADDRQAAFTDILWALVNTQEFITNH